jgi:hypothetical protein
MSSISRRLATLLATVILASCGGTPGVPAPATSPPSIAAPPTSTAAPAPSQAISGGPSISSILGTSHLPPALTTWARVTDPAAAFSYEVPSTWTGHAANPWVENGLTIGTVLAAGPDPAKLATDFSVPGVVIGVSANPSSMTAHDVVEADDAYAGTCTPGPVQDATESGATASFRLWEACAGGTGFLLVMAIVPADGKGLLAIVFQGVTEADLGYLDHIAGSIHGATAAATPGPHATPGGPVTGQPNAISI